MGWEDLPPEVPTWKHMPATAEALALVISHEGHIAKLEERIKVSDEHFKESVEMYMETINGLESRVRELEAELIKIALVIGSPKDAHRLPETLTAMLSSYRNRGEKAEAERDELKRAYDAILDDCRIQEERIKVLEDALNLYVSKFGNCGDVYDFAIKALEVK